MAPTANLLLCGEEEAAAAWTRQKEWKTPSDRSVQYEAPLPSWNQLNGQPTGMTPPMVDLQSLQGPTSRRLLLRSHAPR